MCIFVGNSWGFLFLLYLYVQLSRCVVVGVLYPLLRRFGYGLDWKESIILTWSGLRGAVSLSLALSVKSLRDWRGLRPCVCFPNYYKFLQSRVFPRKLVSFLIVRRLESACYISSAFLRARRIVRQQRHSNAVSTVINESEVEGEEAKHFLEAIRFESVENKDK